MKKITVAKGDGIGPEIMDSTLEILKASGCNLQFEEITVGEQVYLSGNTSGISDESWDIIKRNKIFLKAPITTPLGGGYKSLNVSTRKFLGLYANVRPCVSYHPFVSTKHPVMDLVIIRENEEDLYAGIEHQQTDEVVQCLKLISRPGCEKIIRYAFEYARQHNRKKVTCMTKDNIMKQTDGLFHNIFNEIAAEYPDIANEHLIIDIGAAKIADTPEKFDVIVTSNLYGDIISDVAAQITGSVGLAGSSNIGEECAMFEAIHGTAPDIKGQDMANPSGLIQAAVLMLIHIGESTHAEKINNAWLKTIEDGIHTSDIYKEGTSKKKVGTREFTKAVISNLGQIPSTFKKVTFSDNSVIKLPPYKRKAAATKKLIGVDIFIHWKKLNPDELAEKMKKIEMQNIALKMITNRGIKVWPNGFKETFCTDHWRCRFVNHHSEEINYSIVIELLKNALNENIDIIKTENLYLFNDIQAFSMGQGQ
jgi:isocitrate dehydrogenase